VIPKTYNEDAYQRPRRAEELERELVELQEKVRIAKKRAWDKTWWVYS
jgi:hypothetical protein